MRTLIFFLLIATTVVGQGKHNDQIVKFVESHVGQKVGGGVCYELLSEAVKTYDSIVNIDSMKIFIVMRKKFVIPGDLMVFDGQYDNGDELSHIAIVVKVEGEDIYIAHQNVGVESLEDSIVVVEKYSEKDFKKGVHDFKVNFIRVD